MEFKKFLQGVGFGTIILLTFLACNALYEYFVPLSQITEDEDASVPRLRRLPTAKASLEAAATIVVNSCDRTGGRCERASGGFNFG
jgi:hypothetical protein